VSVAAPPRPPVTDEPEALIEEARRRARRRRRGYGICLLVFLGAGLGLYFGSGHGGGSSRVGRESAGHRAGSPAEEAQRIVQVGARTIIGEADLVEPGVGWAMNGLGLWWTHDGGTRWRTITPPQIRATGDVVARVVDIASVGDDRIWIAAADIAGREGLARHMAIERTRDGGRTWESVIPPGCDACAGAHLSFLDADRGYALIGAQSGPRLYETRDGGRVWQKVQSDVSITGLIRFVTSRDGWAVTDPGGVVYATHDGGGHWRRIRLAAPPQYRGQPQTAGIPRFFNAKNGVVAVRFRDGSHAQHVVVYVTHDGGGSWTAHPAPSAVDLRAESWGFPESVPFSAATVDDWFLFANRDLYTTRDGGRGWSATRTSAPRAPAVWDVAFASPTYGWAIFAPIETGPRAGSSLVETTDGGRHWKPLAPH
jgi:photosystem II stability/assembly factor-like uncharacterized protein